MHVRFLLGPAGSGKTFRCLAEIRDALLASPDGPPLLFLAPKQATFQLERQLLDDPALSGYTRLRILSFERLAEFVFHHQNQPRPELLDEEGRVMVLRALLTRKREELRLFRASARLPGFAEQLSRLLRELQQHQLTPSKLGSLAARVEPSSQLAAKLHDLASMQRAYFDWLKDRNLEDADRLPDLAAALLKAQISNLKSQIFEGLWLDGFAQMTPQELELLAAVAPHCRRATLAFCLEAEPQGAGSWLSMWTLIGQTFQLCRERLRALMSEGEVLLEVLPRDASRSRFRGNAALQHLERHWAQPRPFAPGAESQVDIDMESNTAASVPLPLPAKCERGEDRGGGKGHADKPPPHAPPLTRPPDTLSPSEGERKRVRGRSRGPMREVSLGRILSPAPSSLHREEKVQSNGQFQVHPLIQEPGNPWAGWKPALRWRPARTLKGRRFSWRGKYFASCAREADGFAIARCCFVRLKATRKFFGEFFNVTRFHFSWTAASPSRITPWRN
jgi:hypothetical protein